MSIEQAKSFTEKLLALSDTFREDCRETTADYIEQLEIASKGITDNINDADEVTDGVREIKEESHEYAKDMVHLADKYLKSIQAAYKEVYP